MNSFSLLLSDIIAIFLFDATADTVSDILVHSGNMAGCTVPVLHYLSTSSTHPGNLQTMNEDLLKTYHERAVSTDARSLITLFREVRSSLANFPMFFNMLEFLITKPLLVEVQICLSLLVKRRGQN